MPRASHVIRIFGTNKQDEVLQDIWLDIERIDVYVTSEQNDGRWQGTLRRLYWLDDPNGAEYNASAGGGNFARLRGTLKICSPDEEDQQDPEQWVPVAINISMQWKESRDDGQLAIVRGNPNSADNATRIVAAQRIWHRDTIIDSDVDAATAADPTLKVYTIAADRYDFADDSDDKEQFLEVQYMSRTVEKVTVDSGTGTGGDQGTAFFLRNAFLLNISEQAKGPVNETHGFNPPWALDPFQHIVNVQWATGAQVVVGMLATGFGSASSSMTTKDGISFNTDNFGSNSFSGATGLGKTVIGNGNNLVAFGKPRDGDACFIVVDGNFSNAADNSIRRGVLNEAGELTWTTIGSFPSLVFGGSPVGAFSCCFAGGAFFIQYLSSDVNNVHMAVSFNGTSFSSGINPFSGVDGSAICNPDGIGSNAPAPIGGSVAYDAEHGRYVTTGSYTRTYQCEYIIHAGPDVVNHTNSFDNNFMSSVSIDGVSWTPKFDTSQGYGTDNFPTNPTADIGGISAAASTVCFNAALGLFVAASTYKNNDQNNDNGPAGSNTQEFPVFIPASAVARSSDGVNWTNKLVGAASSRQFGVGDQYSFSNCVTFVKTGTVDPVTGNKGFFLSGVNGGTNSANPPLRAKNEMWRSTNGVDWTQTRSSTTGFPAAMTQVSKTADPDKVVHV